MLSACRPARTRAIVPWWSVPWMLIALAKAALPLGDVVGDVRHEVGVRAVGLAHHAVLVVAVVGGAQPQRAVLLVGLAGATSALTVVVDLAVGVQARLEVVVVEAHAERLQVEVLLVAQVGDREAADARRGRRPRRWP